MNASIDALLRGAVVAGVLPNVVAIAADRHGTIYEGAAGPRTVGSDQQVGADSVYRIASMTKMVVTIAALQQVERGTIDWDAPVERYCPEFADAAVLEGFDGDSPRLRAPASKATIRQLATHTSGLSYAFWNADIRRWEAVTGTPSMLTGKLEVLSAPMVADPGTRIEYGISTDWLGRVVEAVTGRSLKEYVESHITRPLGMSDTTFLANADQRARLVPIHVKSGGGWVATDLDWNQQPDFWSGGGGLYSTPRDYLKFQQMLLAGGTLGDRRIVQQASVDAAFTNQVGDLEFPATIVTVNRSAKWRSCCSANCRCMPVGGSVGN